ncbi:MAG: MBL fold metallo-hydrolase [Myxococcota bacterium]|nr:MBL fold metallo-hydrolase [Myxococcota bacterium]
MSVGAGLASIHGGVVLRWLGASTFEIEHAGRVLLLDPFLSRPDRARPSLPADAVDRADAILVTHGHLEHWADVPDLARRFGSVVYLPDDLHRMHALKARLLGHTDDERRWRSWSENRRVEVAGLIVQAFPVHREDVSAHWLRRAARAAVRGHWGPRTIATALRLSACHPFGSATAIHVTHAATGTAVFFFGCLTREIRSLPKHPLPVDVVAIPAAQDSDWWIDDAAGLVSLLRPRVVMLHHHDDWCPPLTSPVDLDGFGRVLRERCDVPLFVPPFATRFTFEDVLAVAKG